MKYRKKPVVIEAWPVKEIVERYGDDWLAEPPCIIEAYERGELMFFEGAIDIKTLEGWHHASPDDMVILGVAGEIYACKPEIFEMTYGPADDDGWIRCEDRLPEEDSDVLAKVAGSGVHLVHYYRDNEGYQYWAEDGNGTYTKGEVTHWRPVPEAPGA